MRTPARTVFLGSGEFAIPIVGRLASSSSVELVAVVSSPPRARGRKGTVELSPAGRWATRQALPLLTPERLRSPEAVSEVAPLEPGLLVLADYGQIVPPQLLDLPRHGALNLHPSLLPRHRGASPVATAILAGDELTGVSLMKMDAGLDTGPLIAQRSLQLTGGETTPELEASLADLAAELLVESLEPWLAGELAARPQPDEGATVTRQLRREDGRLDVDRPAIELERQVRAYQPWPGSFLELPTGRLVVWRAALLPDAQIPSGELVSWTDSDRRAHLGLTTADGLLELLEVQPAGGRRMTAADFVRGRPQAVRSLPSDVSARWR